jgi:hypothetical protein
MIRRLTMLAVVLVLTCPAVSRADLDIDPGCRIENVGSGYCAWCNLEMLGRQYKIKSLYGLVERRQKLRFWSMDRNGYIEDGSAGVEDLAAELDKLGLKYRMQKKGRFDSKIIMDASTANLGCIVSVRDYPVKGDHHSILITSWPRDASDDITFIDCNALWTKTETGATVPQVRACGLGWFAKHWTGNALVLMPRAPDTEVQYVVRRPVRPTQTNYPFKDSGYIYKSQVSPASR